MQGPFEFVRSCLDSNMPVAEEGLQKWLLSFIFIVLFPFAMPVAFLRVFMQQSWCWGKVGEQRIQWSREHNFFKIFQDNDDFISANARIDISRLRLALQNNTEESLGHVLYLSDQDFQAQLSLFSMQLMIGIATLLLTIALVCIRHSFKHSRWLKAFVFNILHFQWSSDNYPKLKFTSGSLFGGRFKLYKVVPCVWMSMILSFTVVVPASIFILDEEYSDVQAVFVWEKYWLVLRAMPFSMLAGYVVGNFYLEMANATFTLWLSTPVEYAVAERQFLTEMGGLFKKLTRHVEYFAVSSDEIEVLSNLRSVELWMQYYTIKAAIKSSHLEDISRSDLRACRDHMDCGDWEDANDYITTVLRSIKAHNKNDGMKVSIRDERRVRMKNHLITKVYIVDTRSDISFWLDATTGCCSRVVKHDGVSMITKTKSIDDDDDDL